MHRLLELLCLCCASMLVATELYGKNGGYPAGVPGAGLHPGDPGYREGVGYNGAELHPGDPGYQGRGYSGAGLHPGDPGYRGRGYNGAELHPGDPGYRGRGYNGAGLHPGDPGYRGHNGAGFHDAAYQFCVPSAEDPDADCIPGEAILNYPVYSQVPFTGFACQDHPFPGYYADQETQCQVFHICQHDGRHDSFLCPNGSIFNQQYFVCDWWYNFDCATASGFYEVNADLYQEPGFYGGAYSTGNRGQHQAGLAHHDGYGPSRASISPYENGRHSNGHPSGLSSAYGPTPDHKTKLLPGAPTAVNGY